MKDLELETVVYRTLDERASNMRDKNISEFDVEAGEMQRAVGAHGRIRAVCAVLQDDSLLSKAGLELTMREVPDSRLATVFRYKVH